MSANTWTHTLCIDCWNARYPEMAQEPLPGEGPEETCCACGRATRDVLPIRAAPETVHP